MNLKLKNTQNFELFKFMLIDSCGIFSLPTYPTPMVSLVLARAFKNGRKRLFKSY